MKETQKYFVLKLLYKIDSWKWRIDNFAKLFSLPGSLCVHFLLTPYITQKKLQSNCIVHTYFLSWKHCFKAEKVRVKRLGKVIIIFDSFLSSFPASLWSGEHRDPKIRGTLRSFVPPGGIFLKGNYQESELLCCLIVTWGIFSVLNITSLSVGSLLSKAI